MGHPNLGTIVEDTLGYIQSTVSRTLRYPKTYDGSKLRRSRSKNGRGISGTLDLSIPSGKSGNSAPLDINNPSRSHFTVSIFSNFGEDGSVALE